MGRSSVVVVQDPLSAFQILFQHFLLFSQALFCAYIKVNFGLIVELLRSIYICAVQVHELCHKL